MILGCELFNQVLLLSKLSVEIGYLVFQILYLFSFFLDVSLALFKLCLIF
jgi:hypothetical protein